MYAASQAIIMYINTVKNAVYYSRDHAIINSSGWGRGRNAGDGLAVSLHDRQARRHVPRTADWPYNTKLLEPMVLFNPPSEVR